VKTDNEIRYKIVESGTASGVCQDFLVLIA